MSETTSGVPNGDAAPWHPFGLAPLALPGAADRLIPLPARVSGTLTAALGRRVLHTPGHHWATDVLISGILWWDGEADM